MNVATKPFQPEGFTFLDKTMGEVMFVQKGPFTGWIAKKHPDGFWVSLRLATEKDLEKIAKRIAVGN